MRVTRRRLIGAAAALAAAPAVAANPSLAPPPSPAILPERFDVAVVGAGVFGAWTAEQLRRAGRRVLLIDAWGPANARASSGGESRMTRAAYGADAIYTRMAWASLPEWKRLSDRAGLPLFHRTGVLFMFARADDPYVVATQAVHREYKLPTALLAPREIAQRWPQIALDGVGAALWEPEFGPLMARRAVQTLVAEYVRAGGGYRRGHVLPPAADRLDRLVLADGGEVRADAYVFAAGSWLPKLFPTLLGGRITPSRQEVYFLTPPPGDGRFGPALCPGWADFRDGDIFYGMPDLEARGFKIAHDAHGPAIDPDSGDRLPTPAMLADARAFLARRFPALAVAPLVEARVCQYENSANGDFLIDRHPTFANVVLVGAGSGHGFKHGPEVGRYAAALAMGGLALAEPRFSLATKAATGARAVH